MKAEAQFFGVYGFEITRNTKVGSFCLYPRTAVYREARDYARDQENFHLTAVGQFSDVLNHKKAYEILYDLSAAMTFCEQQWVAIMPPFKMAAGTNVEEAIRKLPTRLDLPFHRYTRGNLIQSDTHSPDQRRVFLELCLAKLADPNFNQQTDFLAAFFRNVESWKLQKAFLDLTYYMDFSALEILARRSANDVKSSAAVVMTPFLQNLGYKVQQANFKELHLGMQNYADVRNALFHNGDFEKQVKDSNGKQVTLRLTEFEGKLRALVPDVLLKVMDYDDPHIHWNRWIDRMPFQ